MRKAILIKGPYIQKSYYLFMIDLWQIPPNISLAQNHGRACKAGKSQGEQNNTKNQICPCCLNTINKEQVSLYQNSKQLEFLGFGIPLYFIFVKYCLILLVILITSYNGFGIYKSIYGNQQFCSHRRLSSSSDPSCTSFFILFSEIQHQVKMQQIIMRIFSFILHLFALIYIRDSIRKILEYYDQRTTSLSDYSILIKHLPQNTGIQKSIQKFIHKHFEQDWQKFKTTYKSEEYKDDKKVMKIILLSNLDDYYKLQNDKKQIILKKKHLLESKDIDGKQLQMVNQQIGEINYKIQSFCQKQQNLAVLDELKCDQAIVILNLEIFKSNIVNYAKQNTLNSKILSQYFGQFQGQLQIIEAPEPKQIIWKNINYPPSKKIGRIALGWLLTVFFIASATVIFYFLLRAKTNYLLQALQEEAHHQESKSHSDMNSALALVYIIIILIILFNKLIMGWVLHYFAHIEKHFTTSDQQFSFAFKYTLGLFFTTAIMTLAVEAVSFHNFYSHAYGVIQQQGIMFFMNAFFVPLIWLINPWQLFVLAKRKFTKNINHLTQWQANQLMEDVEYTVGKRYAQVIQIMWFTFLYATLIPLGGVLSLFGIGLYYWVDKYNLLRRSCLKTNLSGDMALFSLKLLEVTLILRPIGQMIFDSQIRDGVSPQSISFVVIGVIYLILPMDKILNFFHQEKYRLQARTYEQVKDSFIQTYTTFHPIMKQTQGRLEKKVKRNASSVLDFGQNSFGRNEANSQSQLSIKLNLKSSSNTLKSFSSENLLLTNQVSRKQLQRIPEDQN